MTWTNAFDVGECTVVVWSGTDIGGKDFPDWSGILAKGDSSPSFDGGPFGNVSMQVAVDGDGVVTLSIDADFADSMSVAVVPSYDIYSADLRVSNLSVVVNNATGIAGNGVDVGQTLTPSSPPEVTPDPAYITSETQSAELWRVSNGDAGGGPG